MSWGFIADLRVSIDTPALDVLVTRRVGSEPLVRGWSGLVDPLLEDAFTLVWSPEETFAHVLAFELFHHDAVYERRDERGRSALRITVPLDRTELGAGGVLARLFFASVARGATATLQLVNDGTFANEAGVTLRGELGRVRADTIEDPSPIAERLSADIVGDAMGELRRVLASTAPGARRRGEAVAGAVLRPARREAASASRGVTKPSRRAAKPTSATTKPKKKTKKKMPAKKMPTKKMPAKKMPAKKAPAKKTTAKKTAKKKTAKKTPAKKTPAKKTSAKKTPAKKTSAKTATAKTATATRRARGGDHRGVR